MKNDRNKNQSLIDELKDVKSADSGALADVASKLMNGQNSIDMGGIMKMATNLMNDETLLSTVKNIAGLNRNKSAAAPNQLNKAEETTSVSPAQSIEGVVQQLAELKEEIKGLKEQNRALNQSVNNLAALMKPPFRRRQRW
ncbi:hypothetical protein [Bacillus sp. T33-2]|uniref:hypothetical protein n=1 Tax=Bacillus sp. T33-2 TaxID=2054168 RepID=UPI000C7672EA|nr:hypothetical protein [Bacillus sp. T33-2]PLR97542.1 hypothetical protein CVD19_08655 [Bacillus sp. T33-2]